MEKNEYDPQKAMQLLEQAGWSRGEDSFYQKDGERLAFVIHNSQGDQAPSSCGRLARMCACRWMPR